MRKRPVAEIIRQMRENEDVASLLDSPIDTLKNKGMVSYIGQLMAQKRVSLDNIAFKSGISRRYMQQIFDGCQKLPRDKALALAIGFELNLQETQNLLKNAGLAPLYVIERKDAVIMFAIRERLTIIETNDILFELGEFMLE